MSDVASAISLIFSLAAFCYAYKAHNTIRNAIAVFESRSSRTVILDHSDGRITIVKELKDAT